MSILERVVELGDAGQREDGKRLLFTEMQKLSQKFAKAASGYPKRDLPLVIASLWATALGIENIVGPEGRKLAESIMAGVNVITTEVDAAELARQMEELEG